MIDLVEQRQIANIIDIAVRCWHEVADDHDIKHCNCFLEKFAQELIDRKLFVGYVTLEELELQGKRHVRCQLT